MHTSKNTLAIDYNSVFMVVQKVSDYQVSSLNCIKNGQLG